MSIRVHLPVLPCSVQFFAEDERSEFNWGLPSSIALCAQLKANLTGVAPEDGTGVENRCKFSPLDLLNYLKERSQLCSGEKNGKEKVYLLEG